ncbi:MAG: phage tail protein [Thiobacillaceae bacterium]|jgi:phage tail-like protein|nr:phage tail protein [Thiobacillaceae bacterium]
MPTRRDHDHLGSGKFRIEIEGVTQGAFTAVSGLEASTDVIAYVDGDDMLVRKRPGRTSYANIVLKRGYVNTDELWNWYRLVMDGQVERRSGSIIVLDETLKEILRYNFFEAWPCRWKSFALDASTADTLVEELEIVVEKIERA